MFNVLIFFFCKADTAITVKSIHLWWQHLVQKTNWIWPWCILLYISLHTISLSSIFHDYGVLTYLASWIFGTYLVISICTLTRMNYVSNHSSIIVSAKLCSSIIGLWSALHLTPSSSFQIPKYFFYGVLRFFFLLICIHRNWTKIEFHPPASGFWTLNIIEAGSSC